jgi:cell division protein FtsB
MSAPKNVIREFIRAYSTVLIIGLAALYVGFSAVNAAKLNSVAQREIAQLRNQLASAQTEKLRMESIVIYYRSTEFQEKELRRSLVLARAGEQVYALPEASGTKPLEQIEVVTTKVQTQSQSSNSTEIWRQWISRVL